MRARKESLCPGCGMPIHAGNWILLFPGEKRFICEHCALSRAAGESWADRMYTELGVTLGDAAHKALARVLHPDAGGNHDAMIALNVARDRAHRLDAEFADTA